MRCRRPREAARRTVCSDFDRGVAQLRLEQLKRVVEHPVDVDFAELSSPVREKFSRLLTIPDARSVCSADLFQQLVLRVAPRGSVADSICA